VVNRKENSLKNMRGGLKVCDIHTPELPTFYRELQKNIPLRLLMRIGRLFIKSMPIEKRYESQRAYGKGKSGRRCFWGNDRKNSVMMCD